MRVTNNFIYRQSSDGLEKANQRYLEINRKITEQSNIVKPSDDPIGAGAVMHYEADSKLLEQYETNATSAKNSLDYEEVSMGSLYSILDRANTLVVQAENGTRSQADLSSIAQELETLALTAADLMNAKGVDGNYIFSGANAKSPPFQIQPDGRYSFSGDEGQRYAQLSDTVSIPVSDSGKKLFQDVPVRHTFTGAVSAGAATLTASGISDQGAFDRFLTQNYDAITPANNTFSLTTVAGVPDTFSFTNAGGTVLASGTYTSGQSMTMFGMELELTGVAGSTVDVTLDAPARDNVLNQLQDVITALRDPNLPSPQRTEAFRNVSVSIANTQESIGTGRSELGARLNSVSLMSSYSAATKVSNQLAINAVAGLDIATASAELVQAEAAITASQQLFSRVTNLSLFNVL